MVLSNKKGKKMCDFSKCKETTYVEYMGKKVCKEHWNELCDACGQNMKKENIILKQINLKRNKKGLVQPLTTRK